MNARITGNGHRIQREDSVADVRDSADSPAHGKRWQACLPDVKELGAVIPVSRQNLQRLSAGDLQVAATVGAGPRRVVAGIVDPERGIGGDEPVHRRLSLDEVARWQAAHRKRGDERRSEGACKTDLSAGARDHGSGIALEIGVCTKACHRAVERARSQDSFWEEQDEDEDKDGRDAEGYTGAGSFATSANGSREPLHWHPASIATRQSLVAQCNSD